MRTLSSWALCVLTCILGTARLQAQVQFLRGDVNDDGRVSISDAHFIHLWRSAGGPPPRCEKAADANDDGLLYVDQYSFDNPPLDDLRFILLHQDPETCDGIPPDQNCCCQIPVAEPRSAPGMDSTPDSLPCDAYTGAALSVNDPEAKIELVDARCPGGQNTLAVVKVRVSHSRSIGGYSGVIDGLGVIADEPIFSEFITLFDGKVRFSTLSYDSPSFRWEPAQGRIAEKIYFNVAPGTPAGEYPILLAEAEMADGETGQAIFPAVADAVLRVEEDVALDAVSNTNAVGHWQCWVRETLPPLGPEDVQAAFTMALVPGEKGSRVTVPFSIEANVPVEGFNFGFYYGGPAWSGKVRLERIVPVERGGRTWENFEYHAPADRRGVWGQAVFSDSDPAAFLPAGERHHVLDLEFQVDADSPDGEVGIDITEVDTRPDAPDSERWANGVRAYGRLLRQYRDVLTCFETKNHHWGIILGQNTKEFLRGDANGDGALSMADAVFLGHSTVLPNVKLPCEDAADADDDGDADFTDAVHIWEHLFHTGTGPADIPPPFPAQGRDETLDPLACDGYHAVPAPRTDDLVRIGDLEAVAGDIVEAPIYMSVTHPLEAYQLLVRYDPGAFTPLAAGVVTDGTVFEARKAFIKTVASNLLPGHIAVAFVPDFFRPPGVPAGNDLLVGKLAGIVAGSLQPGDAITLEPVAFADGDAPRPDRLRTEVVESVDRKPAVFLSALEAGVIRIVDGGESTFIRGDANFDLEVNISDAVYTLAYLFLGGPAPPCEDAADADDTGQLGLTDAVFTLNFLFSGGARPLPPPYPFRGRDGEKDDLAPCRDR